jgi:Mn-containing catalase
MLATAVALNLEGAPLSLQEEMAADPVTGAVMSGYKVADVLPRHILSTGGAATPEDANGTPFNCSHVYASGNLVADMYANATAEASGRVLATRLYEMTDDPGMKEMLSFLIARDTMHQQQWLAVIEELEDALPIPSDFPQSLEQQQFSYAFMVHSNGPVPLDSRFTQGPSLDGKGEFSVLNPPGPFGQEPILAPPPPKAHGMVQVKEQYRAPALWPNRP